MNTRLLYVVLFVQCVFAGALLYVGHQSRANRKQDYLELTHRVTAGHASGPDFEKLAGFLPENADKIAVRSLFGLPLMRAERVEFADGKSSGEKSTVWLYYPLTKPVTPETPPAPIDATEAKKFSGAVSCFVVEFDERGRAQWRMAMVKHPLP